MRHDTKRPTIAIQLHSLVDYIRECDDEREGDEGDPDAAAPSHRVIPGRV